MLGALAASPVPSAGVPTSADGLHREVVERSRREGRRFVALEVGRFVLAGLIALAIVALATAVASRRVGEREAIASARTTTVTKAQGVVDLALTDAAWTVRNRHSPALMLR